MKKLKTKSEKDRIAYLNLFFNIMTSDNEQFFYIEKYFRRRKRPRVVLFSYCSLQSEQNQIVGPSFCCLSVVLCYFVPTKMSLWNKWKIQNWMKERIDFSAFVRGNNIDVFIKIWLWNDEPQTGSEDVNRAREFSPVLSVLYSSLYIVVYQVYYTINTNKYHLLLV